MKVLIPQEFEQIFHANALPAIRLHSVWRLFTSSFKLLSDEEGVNRDSELGDSS